MLKLPLPNLAHTLTLLRRNLVYNLYFRGIVKPLDRLLNEVVAKISEGFNQSGRNVSDAASYSKDKVTGDRQHIFERHSRDTK